LAPALFLGLCVTVVSAQTAFYIAPWGNRQFEVLITKLAAQKTSITLREGTFSDGFFNLVVYANKVDSKKGYLENVFIYDERNPAVPITIIAKSGEIKAQHSDLQFGAALKLFHGEIHRLTDGRHTRINFNQYDINLSSPLKLEERKKSSPSLTLDELIQQKSTSAPEQQNILDIEIHKRMAISLACFIFAALGVGLGTVTNRRNARSGQMVLCIGLIMSYWIIYVLSENAARSGLLPPIIALWSANVIFGFASWLSLRRL
jgi:lipopolysaccharide export system permease protein